jgi:hypothetical protein
MPQPKVSCAKNTLNPYDKLRQLSCPALPNQRAKRFRSPKTEAQARNRRSVRF